MVRYQRTAKTTGSTHEQAKIVSDAAAQLTGSWSVYQYWGSNPDGSGTQRLREFQAVSDGKVRTTYYKPDGSLESDHVFLALKADGSRSSDPNDFVEYYFAPHQDITKTREVSTPTLIATNPYQLASSYVTGQTDHVAGSKGTVLVDGMNVIGQWVTCTNLGGWSRMLMLLDLFGRVLYAEKQYTNRGHWMTAGKFVYSYSPVGTGYFDPSSFTTSYEAIGSSSP